MSWIGEQTGGARVDAGIATGPKSGPIVQSARRHMEGATMNLGAPDAKLEGAAKAVRFSAAAPPRAPVSGGGGSGGGGSGSSGGGGGSRGGGGGGASDARRKRSTTLRQGHSVVSGLLFMKLNEPTKKFTEKESIEVLW